MDIMYDFLLSHDKVHLKVLNIFFEVRQLTCLFKKGVAFIVVKKKRELFC